MSELAAVGIDLAAFDELTAAARGSGKRPNRPRCCRCNRYLDCPVDRLS